MILLNNNTALMQLTKKQLTVQRRVNRDKVHPGDRPIILEVRSEWLHTSVPGSSCINVERIISMV